MGNGKADDRSDRIVSAVVATTIVAFAALLRFYQASEPLWLDELHTAWVVADGLDPLADRARQGNQGPLYFYLPWAATQVFGASEISLRLPSLFAGLALVALLFFLVKRWTGSLAAAALASLLAALDRDFIFFSQEARPYAFVQLVGLAQAAVFSRLLRESSPRWRAGFVALSATLFHLHYTAALLFLAEVLAWLALQVFPKRPAYRFTQALFDLAIVGMLCLPSASHVMEISERREQWALFVGKPALKKMLTIFPLQEYLLALLAALAAVWLLDQMHFAISPRTANSSAWFGQIVEKERILFWIAWLIVPVMSAWSLAYWDVARLWLTRYVLVASVAPLLLASAVCALPPPGLSRAVVAMVTLLVAADHAGLARQWQRDGRLIADRRENWPAALAHIEELDPQGRLPVLVQSGLIEADALPKQPDDLRLREYCLLPVRSIYRLDDARWPLIPLSTRQPAALRLEDRQEIERAGEALLLVRGDARAARHSGTRIVRSLSEGSTHWSVASVESFGLVSVARLVVVRPPPNVTPGLTDGHARSGVGSPARGCMMRMRRVTLWMDRPAGPAVRTLRL